MAEGAWDAGCASGCLISAALSAANAPMAISLLTALPCAALLALLLRRYYGSNPSTGGTEIEPVLATSRPEL
jgi:hypothetical protein